MEPEPERESWHEAGHAVVAHHSGIRVSGIGLLGPKTPRKNRIPSAFVHLTGSHEEAEAKMLMAGSAAEILKCGDFDRNGQRNDVEKFDALRCGHPTDYHIGQAIAILKQRDVALTCVRGTDDGDGRQSEADISR
jgi:hypothetical protein